ncbi:MAG: hypothetical protein I3270_01885 [Candidatus Moeniiplasma glomeromycotorum]|nr:hypothetical protein [Candidatus Moeniiplasma glomeromycotorum]MCE8162452.1 hypothetical protein [Candidatus Moeniiplasma glomeromycotorum]MCE8166378.1 hypothetical protein [Candidatus Moeniiplasma glomeromycotorum]MCE8166860.1 hypothetical protein [Candidatus Moeniiplasma glomeromycotorum]
MNKRIFSVSKTYAYKNDPLREKKTKALNSIKDYLQGIDKEVKLEILEKHLWEIIRQYKLSYQQEDTILRNLSAKYPDFENDWYERIANSKEVKEINEIYGVVEKALLKYSGLLTQELKRMRNETSEVWLRTDFENGRKQGIYVDFSNPESVRILRGKLGKFRAKFPFSVNNGDWEKEWVRKVLDDTLQAEIKEAEAWEKTAEARKKEAEVGLRSIHDERLNKINHILKNAEFSQYKKKNGTWEWKVIVNEEEMKIDSFRNYVKIFIENDNLNEEWLPVGQKKADLLSKLESLIQEKTKSAKNNSNTNDNTNSVDKNQVNQSPKTPEVEVNSSQPSTSEPAKSEWEKLVEEEKVKAVKKITAALQTASLSQNDLKEEYRNWQEQIDFAVEEGSATKIQDIESKLLAEINHQKEVKENSAKLDNLLQKFSNKDKTVNKNELADDLRTVNENLGEVKNQTKNQEVKEVMRENDPEAYFEAFVKWVKEEMEVCQIKDDELEANEKKLINGEITDSNQSKQVEKALEEKIITKKHSWSFRQKLNEWQNWLKNEAANLAVNHLEEEVKKIKRQIYSLKFSSNFLKTKAYQENEAKTNQLLAEINNISQKNQPNSSPSASWPKTLGIGALIVVPVVLVVGGIIVRQRSRIKSRWKGQK